MQFGDTRLPDRFWDKCAPEPNTGCWIWIGALSSGVNPRPTIVKGGGVDGNQYAYRVAFVAAHGEIPAGHGLTSKCSTFCCVNPDHFRSAGRGAINREKSRARVRVCKNGHPFTHENTYYRHGGGRQCKACHAARARKPMSEAEKARRRAGDRFYRLWERFGMTRQMFDAMLAEQDGRCAICCTVFNESSPTTKPQVDHDHETGYVRGLLCLRCNNGIGAMNDDIDRLHSAIAYLENARECQEQDDPPTRSGEGEGVKP